MLFQRFNARTEIKLILILNLTGIATALESRTELDGWVGGSTGLMPWQASVFGSGPEEVLSLVRFLADEVMSLLKGATAPRGGGWEMPLPPSLQPWGGLT